MKDRFSIIGFTEAELGFIAAILLFAAMSAHRTAVAKPVSQPTPAVSRKDFENLQREFSQEIRKSVALQHELERQRNLRSRQKPSCIERRVAQGFVAEVQVAGIDQFQLEDDTYDMKGLLQRLSPQLKQGQDAGCVQSIRVTPGANISTPDYVRATNALGRQFYLDDRPAN